MIVFRSLTGGPLRAALVAGALALLVVLLPLEHASGAVAAGAPAQLPSCGAESFSGPLLPEATRSAAKVTAVGDEGGRIYSYAVGTLTYSIPVPPRGFEPEKASDATLEAYGFPPRPADAASLQFWQQFVSAYKYSAPPIACQGPTPPLPNAEPVYHGKRVGSLNWSGVEDAAPSNPAQWDGVTGRYTQANGTARGSCKSNAIVSSWTGLGGDPSLAGNGALLQSGTDAYAGGGYDAWEEWISSQGYTSGVYVPLTVRPGDVIEEGTLYGTAYNHPAESVYFYNTNITTGEQFIGILGGQGPSYYYDGSSTEFIDERPSGAGGYYPLDNFGSIPWTWGLSLDTNGYWSEFGVPNHYRDAMVDSGGTLLAEPSLLESSHSFTDHYYGCQ
jgi:Peptidase A4 family